MNPQAKQTHNKKMPPSQTIIYNKRGPVAEIQLNRPHVHNAFNTTMRDGLYQALEAARDDSDVGALLLSGIGKSFCAGADLTEFGSAPSDRRRPGRPLEPRSLGPLPRPDKPLVVAIHGHCIGSGLEMALLCDLRLASTDASFAMPEANLGLIPAAGGTQTLPRTIALSKALHLLLTGQSITAQEALKYGLVTRLTPPERLNQDALALAHRLASLDVQAVMALKQAINHGSQMPLPQALQMETRLTLNLAHHHSPPPTPPS